MFSKEKVYNLVTNCIFSLSMSIYIVITYVNINIEHHTRISLNFFAFFILLLCFFYKKLLFLKLNKSDLYALLSITLFFILKVIYGEQFSVEYSSLIFMIGAQIFLNTNYSFLKFSILTKIAILVITISLAKLGYIESIEIVKQDYSIVTSQGFRHTNGLGILSLSIIIDIALITHSNNIRKIYYLLIIAFIAYIYFISKARTTFLLSFITFVFIIFRNKLNLKVNVNLLSFFILIVISAGVFLPYFYQSGSDIWDKLNLLFNQRLFLGNLYINEYGISYFPQKIEQLFLQREYDVIMYYNDNSFLASLLSYGIIGFFVINLFLLYKQRKNNCSMYVGILLIICLISMIFESNGYNVFLFSPLLFIFTQEVKK